MVDHAAVYTQDAGFASRSAFDDRNKVIVAVHVPLWIAVHTGLGRLIAPAPFQDAGYPAEIVPEMAALQSTNGAFDTNAAEATAGLWGTVTAAAAVSNFGDLPLAVLWAGDGAMTLENARMIRDEVAALSTNVVVRFIEGADHLSILGNEQYARQVTNAIQDVIQAAQTGEPLPQ